MTLATLTDQIWSALQRPSPSVTKEEINEIVTAWYLECEDHAANPEAWFGFGGAVRKGMQAMEDAGGVASRLVERVDGETWHERNEQELKKLLELQRQETPEHALIHQYYEGTVGDVLLAGLPGETPPKYYLRWRNEDGKEHRLPLEVREADGEGAGG